MNQRRLVYHMFDWESQDGFLDHFGGSASFGRSYVFVGTLAAL